MRTGGEFCWMMSQYFPRFLDSKGLGINARDRGGRKSDISRTKVVTHLDFETTFQKPSKNLQSHTFQFVLKKFNSILYTTFFLYYHAFFKQL